MNTKNWPRIILCGLVAGTIFTLLGMVTMATFGSELMSLAGKGAANTGPALYAASVLSGIWAVWLYAAIGRGGFGTVIRVSLAWWLLASLQSYKWMLLLDIPLSAALPMTANLAPTVIAVWIGAMLFDRVS